MPRSSAPTRQAILDGAYGLFRRKGFVRVSMDEIAASAAVTKRTLYYHFTSKDLLLAEVLSHVWRRSCRLSREHHRSTFQRSRRLVGPAAMGRFGIYSPCYRACRSPWTPRAPDRAPSQGNARRSSGGPFGKRPCAVITRTCPRNLAAFRGRNRPDSYPWRPQLRCGGRGSGQETDPLRLRVEGRLPRATDSRRAKEMALALLNRPLRANLLLDIGNPRRHAEFPAAHLGKNGHALTDLLARWTGKAQPQPAAGMGLVGGPFRSRVDRDTGGKRGLIEF